MLHAEYSQSWLSALLCLRKKGLPAKRIDKFKSQCPTKRSSLVPDPADSLIESAMAAWDIQTSKTRFYKLPAEEASEP